MGASYMVFKDDPRMVYCPHCGDLQEASEGWHGQPCLRCNTLEENHD